MGFRLGETAFREKCGFSQDKLSRRVLGRSWVELGRQKGSSWEALWGSSWGRNGEGEAKAKAKARPRRGEGEGQAKARRRQGEGKVKGGVAPIVVRSL